MPKAAVKSSKKTGAQEQAPEDEVYKSTPKSFVVKRGHVAHAASQLVRDLRLVMSPWCAKNLREKKDNKLRDFISIAGPLSVTHLQMLSQTDRGLYLRIARLPAGPTLTFRVHQFSTMRDVRKTQRKPRSTTRDFERSPLVVLNGFKRSWFKEGDDRGVTQEDPLPLTVSMLQNLFPPLDVKTMQLSECRRVALYSRNAETNLIEFRHFGVSVKASASSRGVRKLLMAGKKQLSAAGRSKDIGDFVLGGGGGGYSSGESDAEEVNSRGLSSEGRSKMSVSLTELGPRMQLQLIKVEEEVCEGAVLFHEYVHKTREELKELQKRAESIKEKRKERKEAAESKLDKRRKQIQKEQAEAFEEVEGQGGDEEEEEKEGAIEVDSDSQESSDDEEEEEEGVRTSDKKKRKAEEDSDEEEEEESSDEEEEEECGKAKKQKTTEQVSDEEDEEEDEGDEESEDEIMQGGAEALDKEREANLKAAQMIAQMMGTDKEKQKGPGRPSPSLSASKNKKETLARVKKEEEKGEKKGKGKEAVGGRKEKHTKKGLKKG
uniref:Brix domain-containing protein n=1 Tax=Chromera velia CCMP2878 TaxID=1169474 RepID=A0A0G4H115_9ALVE|eukprot:Cvel_24245.t1-p1 / transcript=Cvel_24245.t1 / gene=Cvel_24245 / organism=Chromera_velia_CCMP2878 / gene_product=Peter Pan-like protein, putative / transcript_product=Peter Pan-like protein, putative / location=Cvel_scaffold2596:22779-24413(-) / protein_length=545 / sequence_SO=supercontig / SO=protein_coding / is_pseudo=false